MPVVQHDDKGGQVNLFFLSVEAKRRADFRGNPFIDDFLSRFNALGDEEGSWAFHLPVEAEIPGMRLLNGLFHFIGPQNNVGAAVLSGDGYSPSMREPVAAGDSGSHILSDCPHSPEVLHQHEIVLHPIDLGIDNLLAVG